MAMLAEARVKQKWSEDPRNTKWSSDKERYGYQILEKMGWADGKGLGKNKSGKTSHVKIKKRKQNLGLGAKESHDNDWIAQQADFNNLLSALQEHSGNAELRSDEQNRKAMLEVAKASRKRVFYKRFIRSKDTSQYSQKDLACIFGNMPSQSAPTTPLENSEDEVASEDSTASCPTIPGDSTSGFVTYTSKQNIQEYFACRMEELRNSKGIERVNEGDKGVDGEKFRDDERQDRVERVEDMDNQDNIGVNSEKLGKKRKVASGEKDERRTQKSRKKSKRSNEQGIWGSRELENGLDAEGNEKKLNDEEIVFKSSKVKTKKSKKRRTKDDSETVTSKMESVTEEKSLCSENGRGDKVKTKKSRKRTKNGMMDTKDKVVSDTVENGLGGVLEQNEENFLFGKEGKVKRKKSKKGKRNFEVEELDELVKKGIEDCTIKKYEKEEDGGVFKQDKIKRKKSKKRTKHDKKDE